MLKRFEVKNIKNFKERCILNFSDVHDYQFNTHCVKQGLLKNAIVYGRNGVGKSNLSMALFDIVATLTDENVGFYRKQFKDAFLNADSDEAYGEFVYAFELNGSEVVYMYRKSDIDTVVAERLEWNGQCIFDVNFESSEVRTDGLKLLGVSSLNQEFRVGEMSFLRYIIKNTYLDEDSCLKALYKFVLGMRWARSFEDNQLIPTKRVSASVTQFLCDNNLVDEYSKFLNEFGIKNEMLVETQMDGKNAIYFKHSKKNIKVFDTASSGTLSLTTLFFVLNIKDENMTFLWLDEFDAFYHFELAEKVINYLARNFEFQTVCTSHNTDLMSNRIMRPDCYFILTEKNLVSLPNATDRELREGHNLEKMFQSGEFEEIDEKS